MENQIINNYELRRPYTINKYGEFTYRNKEIKNND